MGLNQIIYNLSRPLGGLQLAKFLTRRHPRIFMYHRVNAGDRDDGISVEALRWQLIQIKNQFNAVSLHDLVEAYENEDFPNNAVALTFDDGYRDFFDFAYPILSELGLPATLFVTTGFVNGDLWLWPDQIRYLLSQTERKCIEIDGRHFWLRNDEEINMAWNQIGDLCLTKENEEKFTLIRALSEIADVNLPSRAPAGYEGLTWSLLRKMVRNPLISIGSHSVSHPIMTKLNKDQLRSELILSKKKIETEINRDVVAFCYPNGQEADINETTRIAVESAGYKFALAAYPKRNPLEDRWAIARYTGSAKVSTFEKSLYGLSLLSETRFWF